MAQTTAIVRNTLSATGSGTTDFTSSGFGTPTAAIIITCSANSTNNPQDNAEMSVGFWDGTDQRVCAIRSVDNQTTTITARVSNDAYGLVGAAAVTTSYYTVSSITDGIRLTLSVDNTTLQRFATVILLAGVSAKTITFTPNATVNATANSASLGFEPELVFFSCVAAGTADTATGNAILSFGFAEAGGVHRMIGYGAVDVAADSKCTLSYSETRCVGQIYNDVETWTGEVTTWGADTFTMTTRTGGSGSDVCFALALGGADLSYDVGTLTTPTSTGTQVNATDVAPDALLLMLSTADSTSLQTGAGANGFTLGLSDGTNEYSHNYYDEDAAATTNTGSVATATAVLDLDSSSGGARTDLCVATVAFDSDSFDLDFTTVDATARKGWWVVFGNPAASGSEGTIAVTLEDFTSAISGTTTVTGTIAVTLANFTPAIEGSPTNTGTINVTLTDHTSSFEGTPTVTGTMAATLENFTSAISGTTTVLGTMAVTLANFISNIAGNVNGFLGAAGSWLLTLRRRHRR